MNLVEIYTFTSRRECQHTHIYLHLVEICAIICTYTSRLKYVRELMKLTLGIDWATGVCLDIHIHSNTGEREPHDVL